MKIFKKLIKSIDIFGTSVKLKSENNCKQKTFGGGIFTLFFSFILIVVMNVELLKK